MQYEVCIRSVCPEHHGLECIACGGCGYIKQWVPVVLKPYLMRDPGRAHLTSDGKMYLMIPEPGTPDVLDLLSGSNVPP